MSGQTAQETDKATVASGDGKGASILVLAPGDGKNSKNVVRDFIYGCWCNGRRIGGMKMPPLNHLYVATVLKEDGHDVRFIDAQVEYEKYAAVEEKRFAGIDFLVMMSSTNSFLEDLAVARTAKKLNPAVRTIFFGSHPTFQPERCLAEEAVDYIVLREPEFKIRDLVRNLAEGRSPEGVAGIGCKGPEGRQVIVNSERFFDINELPIPDWTMLPAGVDYFNPVVKRMPYATMQTSRGCPAKCIFCTAPTFYGRDIRVKTTENVLKEIRYLTGLGYREIFFRDETFTAYRKRNQEICRAIIDEKLDVTWIANGRVDMIDKETMALMKQAGCHMIKFGVETGSDQLLLNMKKGTTVSQCVEAFRAAHEVGIDTHAHIIFGGPGETERTVLDTIEFVKKIDPATASFGILTPYPGTEFFDMVAEQYPELGDGTMCDMEKLHTTVFYNTAVCDIGPERLQKLLVKAYRSFYFRPGYIFRWLGRIGSFDELMRLAVAGSNIAQFSLTSRK